MSQNYRNIVWSVALVGLLALSGTAFAQQKTVKQCNEEWKANKTAIQASGKKKADFITECRAGEATAAPGGAAAGKSATPPSAATTQPPAGAKPTSTTTTARTGAGTAIGAGQFTTEAQAKTLPRRHGCVGELGLQDLPLQRQQELREHEERRIHVREGDGGGRRACREE
jgi:hypothetical protein